MNLFYDVFSVAVYMFISTTYSCVLQEQASSENGVMDYECYNVIAVCQQTTQITTILKPMGQNVHNA